MTMNEMDGDTKHEYDRYANEVQQLEWERAVQARKLRWVEDSLREALREYDAEHPEPTTSTDTHAEQAQHVGDEHTHGMAVTADEMMPDVTHDVKPMGRPVTYKTGVRLDGYEEESSTMLCYLCDREAEYHGYCEPHWEEKRNSLSEQEMQEHDAWLDDLWDAEELERAEREAEEGRSDH